MDSESGFSSSDFPGVKPAHIFSDDAKDGFVPEMHRDILELDPEGYLGREAWRDGGLPFFDDNHPVSKVIRPIIKHFLHIFMGAKEELESALT